MKIRLLLAVLLTALINARQLSVSTQLLFIDTTHTSAINYHTFISLAQAAGITILYEHPSTLLDREFCGCDGVILALDDQFLAHQDSLYAQLVIKPLQNFIRSKNKFIWLLLSDRALQKESQPAVLQFLDKLTLNSPLLQQAYMQFRDHKEAAKPLYTTAQCPAASTRISLKKHLPGVSYFPRTSNILRSFTNNLPIALLIPVHTHHVIFSSCAQMTFADLSENCALNPLCTQQRKQLLRLNGMVCADICAAIMKTRNQRPLRMHWSVLNELVNERERYRLNSTIYKEQKGVYQWTSNGICCGWMGMVYDPELIEKNCTYVAQTDFDMLWLELPIKLYAQPEKFDEAVALFTKNLVNAYKKLNKKLPKIFLDFDVAATLSWCTLATHPIDIYGVQYKQVPAPLDYEQFWRPAILTVMKKVFDQWRSTIGTGIPIDGVLFNLYFWNNKDRLPYYTNLLDVSDSAWHHFNAPDSEDTQTPAQRINYLLSHNKMDEYLFTLEYAAYQLALYIKNDIKQAACCAMIGVYTTAPLDTWFYKGLLRGLSDIRNPVLWFTNNLNYYGHAHWWQANTINALHATNILLSHFNHPHDITLINKIARNHDGLWYSRVSRIGQPYETGKWWSTEATTMKPDRLVKLISKQAHK